MNTNVSYSGYHFNLYHIMSTSSYDRAKHIVEVDERILAVFIVNSTGTISDLFVAEDANINHSFVETIRTTLNIRFEGKNESTKDQPLGQHLDILEYDKVRIIKIHESERLIVVLAKSHSSAGDIAETVLGYLYESEDEQPKSLF
jgi:hypothetical protein